MKKKVLTEIALFYGDVSMPKGFEIDRSILAVDSLKHSFRNLSKYIKHDIKYNLKKLKQFNVNHIFYDDSKTIKNLHKIKTNFKNFKPEKVENYLTNDMIKYVERFEIDELN